MQFEFVAFFRKLNVHSFDFLVLSIYIIKQEIEGKKGWPDCKSNVYFSVLWSNWKCHNQKNDVYKKICIYTIYACACANYQKKIEFSSFGERKTNIIFILHKIVLLFKQSNPIGKILFRICITLANSNSNQFIDKCAWLTEFIYFRKSILKKRTIHVNNKSVKIESPNGEWNQWQWSIKWMKHFMWENWKVSQLQCNNIE